MARSIAPDVNAPAAVPNPEPSIADDAAVCARVNLYAFSLKVVMSIPNQSGVQLNTEPAYNFFDAICFNGSPAKKFTVNTQSNERSSNIAPKDSHDVRICVRMSRNFFSSAAICFSADVRTMPNTRPARPVIPESASRHWSAIVLHFVIARSPADLDKHLSNVFPHSVIMQLLYRFPQSAVFVYDDNFISCFLSSLISLTNTENSCAVHVVFFLHAFNLSEKVVSESVEHFA